MLAFLLPRVVAVSRHAARIQKSGETTDLYQIEQFMLAASHRAARIKRARAGERNRMEDQKCIFKKQATKSSSRGRAGLCICYFRACLLCRAPCDLWTAKQSAAQKLRERTDLYR